jgi:tetratricopeptide (TPR) repeat protein
MAKARRARPRSAPKPTSKRAAPPATAAAPPRAARGAAVQEAPKPQERKSTYPDAVSAYERGIAALQRRDYQTAAAAFRDLMARFPEERELQERAQVYLRVCERELAAAAAPRTTEERLVAATVALNAGDHARTLALLDETLRDDPKSDLAEYMAAVVLCAKGDPDAAIGRLRRAIELNPENRNLARQDSDLESLHAHEAFKQLVEAPSSQARRRKPRAGR